MLARAGLQRAVPGFRMLLGLWEVRPWKQRHPLSVVQRLKLSLFLAGRRRSIQWTCSFYSWRNKTPQCEVDFFTILTAIERQNQTWSISSLYSTVLLVLCEAAVLMLRLKKDRLDQGVRVPVQI